MNPVQKLLRTVDRGQQRFRPTALVYAVVKKYGDDNGGVLVTNLTYTAFISIFPLLLVLVTILGLVAANDPQFRQQAVTAVTDQVPLIGRELAGNVHELQRSSVIGLVIGLVGLLYGCTGLAQAGLYTMEQVWNIPGPARPSYLKRLGRALAFLGLLGVLVIVTMGLAAVSNYGHRSLWLIVPALVVQAIVNAVMFLAAFRILTPHAVSFRDLIPGAGLAGVLWTVLQVVGTYLVHHFLHSDSVYGVFATVLGLVAWLYIACEITVYSAELNVVLHRRLWPRSLIQPPLTEADRHSLTLRVLQSQRRKEQEVTVTYRDTEPEVPAQRGTSDSPRPQARVPHGAPQSPDRGSPPPQRRPEL